MIWITNSLYFSIAIKSKLDLRIFVVKGSGCVGKKLGIYTTHFASMGLCTYGYGRCGVRCIIM